MLFYQDSMSSELTFFQVAALYQRISALKQKQNGLEVWISVGGWSFNDPGSTATTFSNLARSTSAQSAFFKSLISFLVNNNFDGVDLDWYVVGSDSPSLTNARAGSIQ